jgi:hypothetical protein
MDLSLKDPVVKRGAVLYDALREPARERTLLSSWLLEIVNLTHSLISFSAFSTVSEPWQMLRPTARAKSPRMVPEFVLFSETDHVSYIRRTRR